MSGAPATLATLLSERERLWRAQFSLVTDRPACSARSLVSRRVLAGLAVIGALLALLLVVARTPAVAGLFLAVAAVALAASAYDAVGRLASWRRERRAVPRAHLLVPDPPMSLIVVVDDPQSDLRSLVQTLRALESEPEPCEVLVAVAGADPVVYGPIDAACSRDARFRIVAVPTTGPVTSGFARNYAFAEAAGGIVAVCGARSRPRSSTYAAAADLLASSPGLAAVVAPPAPTAVVPSPVAAWDDLVRTADRRGDAGSEPVVVFRRSSVLAAGGWDPYNHRPDLDLRRRIARSGGREVVLRAGGVHAPVADPVERIRSRATALAGILQCALVDRRAATSMRQRWSAAALLARAPLALVRPVLVVMSVVIIAEPSGASDVVRDFPAAATPVAFAVLLTALTAFTRDIARGARTSGPHVLAAVLRPLWSLLDACSAVKALLLLADGRQPADRLARYPAIAPTP